MAIPTAQTAAYALKRGYDPGGGAAPVRYQQVRGRVSMTEPIAMAYSTSAAPDFSPTEKARDPSGTCGVDR